jgi:hypothetical protein
VQIGATNAALSSAGAESFNIKFKVVVPQIQFEASPR